MLDNTPLDSPGTTLPDLLTWLERHSPTLDPGAAREFDAKLRVALARATRGMSPPAIVNAYIDWLGHLALSPGRIALLIERVGRRTVELGIYGVSSAFDSNATPPEPVADPRLTSAGWQRWPFSVLAEGYTITRSLVAQATADVPGVRPEHRDLVAFLSQQMVEALSPANLPLTNPQVISTTLKERGANLGRGLRHLLDDVKQVRDGHAPASTDDYRVGHDIAITPGKVVFQNELFELIQYAPATETVGAEPVLIVPAWIMKYYILDLSPHNSLVRYLRDQGKTVFILSWKNPDATDRDRSMDDYLKLGVMAALEAVTAITRSPRVHGVGYCLGGTLLTIAAAWMAREADDRFKSLSLFASQIDFSEAGEIRLFLGESEQSFLEPLMADQGYLGIESMVGAFKSLRSSALVFAPAVSRYLLGETTKLNDLMAWNADGTRMPQKMHREYLRRCYLDNDLAQARYPVDGRPICVGDIQAPTFVLATLTDHVAPWHSVYKALRLMHGDLTFALTTAGHNAGIVSGPDHPRRRYQIAHRRPGDLYIDPDTWQSEAPQRDGSWWPAWNAWLDEQIDKQVKPPPMGAPARGYPALRDAPGDYVFG